MTPVALLGSCAILVLLSGSMAYGISAFTLRMGANTRTWAVVSVISGLICALATLLFWPDGLGMPPCVFGGTFGAGLARTNHLMRAG